MIVTFMLSFLAVILSVNMFLQNRTYFLPPDSYGGWITLADEKDIRTLTGIYKAKPDEVYDFGRSTSANG